MGHTLTNWRSLVAIYLVLGLLSVAAALAFRPFTRRPRQ
jgi:hypothetical protein